jgi:hypothetical protein
MLDSGENRWKKDVLEIVTDRFERRLTEEIGAVRLEIAALRVESAAGRLSMILWMFVFWVGQVALNVWVVLTIFHATKLH